MNIHYWLKRYLPTLRMALFVAPRREYVQTLDLVNAIGKRADAALNARLRARLS
jgi:hypothetical protein